jgi:hypothetical protein
MVGAHPSPIPASAGTKIYANENWDDDEKFRNLYQQYCGCINYATLIRPELSYYASQICRVMSMPNEENLHVTQNVLKYALGSLDEKITYRPADANDPLGDFNYGLMAFTDSDWATSVDTRHSHGCYIIKLAGGCIAHRSKHLKECSDEGIVELRHIGTKYQLSDIGTKALPAPVFLPLRDVILGKVSFSDLQGL